MGKYDVTDISEYYTEEIDVAEWMANLKTLRKEYGASQEDIAKEVGIGTTYLSKLENGKKPPTVKLLKRLEKALELYNPLNEMEILFDYVRIRFQTNDERRIIEKVLRIRLGNMLEEPHAFYGYGTQYFIGDIVVMLSPEKEKGTLLELKGKGCRQFETYLNGQKRTWYDFFRLAKEEGAVLKRIDIAINDRAGILNIPELGKKCYKDECISLFRSFKHYQSGELIRSREEDEATMGNTLYLGSLKSDIYFCIYEKDYEQFIKNGVPIEEAETKNRFEIRLKNDRAELAMDDILEYEDVARTAVSIINRYVRFVDADITKQRRSWDLNERWERFIEGEDHQIKLTMKPEPYTLDRTMVWLCRQVMPSIKMVKELDRVRGTDLVDEMIEAARLSPQHKKIILQQSMTLEDIIISDKESDSL